MFGFLKRRRKNTLDYYKCKLAKRYDGPIYLYFDAVTFFLRDKLRWENYMENPTHTSFDIRQGNAWVPVSEAYKKELYIPLPGDVCRANVKIISEEKNTFALQEIAPLAGKKIKPRQASSYRVHWLRVITVLSLPGEVQLSFEVLQDYS